jgi:chromosome segregation ATPase
MTTSVLSGKGMGIALARSWTYAREVREMALNDDKQQGIDIAILKTDLSYIKEQITDIKEGITSMTGNCKEEKETLISLSERVTAIELTKIAPLEKRISHLETVRGIYDNATFIIVGVVGSIIGGVATALIIGAI